MFTGLSAFPLTPLRDDAFDVTAYSRIIERLAHAEVDSITALGSTGSYMYLDRKERERVVRTAVEHADQVPVLAGIGALRTTEVQRLAEDAQNAGASGVLLAPVTYQALSDDEVFGLFKDVTAELSVPLVVYDNPGTTHVHFTDELYARITTLPQVASIKIPALPRDPESATQRLKQIRKHIPDSVTLGISGDGTAVNGLIAGCDAWYSAIGGTLPEPAVKITRATLFGDHAGALAEWQKSEPLWALFAEHGSLRVIAAIAEELGLVAADCLPRPVQGLGRPERARVAQILSALDLTR